MKNVTRVMSQINTGFAVTTEEQLTKNEVKNIFDAVDNSQLSEIENKICDEVTENWRNNITTPTRHDEYNSSEPCPVCGGEERFLWIVMSERYQIVDGEEKPAGDSVMHDTIKKQCTTCETVLYESVK